MLPLPTRVPRSITSHNANVEVLCDWIETHVLFANSDLSQSDLVDFLIENERYDDQDFAREFVGNCWIEMERRSKLYGMFYNFTVSRDWCRCIRTWEEVPAYSFCLLLSVARIYDWWHETSSPDYTEQGLLFELMTEKALEAISPQWKTFVTGWSRSNATSLREVADDVALRVRGKKAQENDLMNGKAKESGLDLLLYRSFPDERFAFPFFLIQCASGKNYKDKLHEPRVNVWSSLIGSGFPPISGLAFPFSLDHQEFKEISSLTSGVLFDRCRILGAAAFQSTWLPDEIGVRIVNWARPRVTRLLNKAT